VDNRKFNAEKWVSSLLRALHKFHTDLWQVRNAALHGGQSKLQEQTLWYQLLQEVHSLYAKDRTCLSLADKEIFNVPKAYRLKQGNHQLLLWTKRAQMTLDICDDIIEGPEQTYITDWLDSWSTSDPIITDDDTTNTDIRSIDSNTQNTMQIRQKNNLVIGGIHQ
jgi:hypothetical protein